MTKLCSTSCVSDPDPAKAALAKAIAGQLQTAGLAGFVGHNVCGGPGPLHLVFCSTQTPWRNHILAAVNAACTQSRPAVPVAVHFSGPCAGAFVTAPK